MTEDGGTSPSDPTLPFELPPPIVPTPARRRTPAQPAGAHPARVQLRWEKLGPGALETQGTAFLAWAMWLIETYALWEVWPTCWHRHPGLVEELTALWAWHLALDTGRQGGDGVAAISWHAALWRFVDRSLPTVLRRCLSRHEEPPPDVAHARRQATEAMRADYQTALASTIELRRAVRGTSGSMPETRSEAT